MTCPHLDRGHCSCPSDCCIDRAGRCICTSCSCRTYDNPRKAKP